MVVATSSTSLSVGDLRGLHHPHHGVVLAPHDAVVARRIGQDGGEQRGRRSRVAVMTHQGGQGRGAHQRGVAGQHHHVPVGVDQALGQPRDPHGHGIAGSELFLLLHEGDGQ
jgi:hypothetical protein